MARAWKVYWMTNSENNDRSLLEFVWSVIQYYFHVDALQLNTPQYWKTKILVDSSK